MLYKDGDVAQHSRWLGRLCEASAFALLLCGGCSSSSSEAPVHDGGAEPAPSATVGSTGRGEQDAAPADGGRDATANDAAAKDAETKDAATNDGATTDGSPTDGQPSGCQTGMYGEPTELRCTGLYSDWATKTVAANVRQYDPGLHLWSDGANKTRWIYLPPGTKIDTTDMDEWTFSPGTKVWKEFVVGGARLGDAAHLEAADRRLVLHDVSLVVRRVEHHRAHHRRARRGWERLWNSPPRALATTATTAASTHVLGFEAVALSTPQASGVTMATLTAGDLVTAPAATPITIPGDATAAAALGYLHMNCGGPCHNRDGGEASDSGPYMRLDVATLASVQTTDTWTTGMGVNALYQVAGLTNPQIFTPCDPAHSAADYRMDHRDGVDGTPDGVQMPPIISHQVDTDGVAHDRGLAQRPFAVRRRRDADRPAVTNACNDPANGHASLVGMCRNIKTLFNFAPPATDEEIRSASEQFVRKLSGFAHPSHENEKAFARAVDDTFRVARRLVDSLVTHAPPRDREIEAAKAKARSIKRFGA